MASNYGRNFGFRVSDETRRSSMGRIKTPVGSALLCGTAVEIDPASPGYLKASASGVKPRTGTSGLLLQEEQWDSTIYQSNLVDSYNLALCLPNRLSVITNGPGTKVWFKNTGSETRADGRVISAVTMFTATSVAVGRGLAWNGTTWIDIADPTAATSFMEVCYFDSARNYVEAILSH